MTAAALSPSRSGLGRGAARQPAYGGVQDAAITPRQAEYRVIARVTHRLSEAAKAYDAGDATAFPRLAEALHENLRLWLTFADDLAADGNGLPERLRADLISLAVFVVRQTRLAVAREIGVDALIEVNASIMKGLRTQAEAA